jgi:hypothetical protein
MNTEREQLMTEAGRNQSLYSCGSCGNKIWWQADGPMALFGRICLSCRKVYCEQCIEVGGATPCPSGHPTVPAGHENILRMDFGL